MSPSVRTHLNGHLIHLEKVCDTESQTSMKVKQHTTPRSAQTNCSPPMTEPMEKAAWDLIQSLSVDSILRHVFQQQSKKFVMCSKAHFKTVALSLLKGWRKTLFLLPRMILQHLKRGGKRELKEICALHGQFLKYQWAELLQLDPVANTHQSNPEAS